MERFLLWCQRNPAVASLSAVAAVLLLVLTIGSTLAAWRFRDLAFREHTSAVQAAKAEQLRPPQRCREPTAAGQPVRGVRHTFHDGGRSCDLRGPGSSRC